MKTHINKHDEIGKLLQKLQKDRLNPAKTKEERKEVIAKINFNGMRDIKKNLDNINLQLRLMRLKIRDCKDLQHTTFRIVFTVTDEKCDILVVNNITLALSDDTFMTSCTQSTSDDVIITLYKELINKKYPFIGAVAHELGHVVYDVYGMQKRAPKQITVKYHHRKYEETFADLFALLVCRSNTNYKKGEIRYSGISDEEYNERKNRFNCFFRSKPDPFITQKCGVKESMVI